MRPRIAAIAQLCGIYILAAASGYLFTRLGMPLPWMLGPLVVIGAVFISGLRSAPLPIRTRPFGQMVVASTVGTYFSPAALQMVFDLAPLLIGMALLTAAMALPVAAVLARIGRLEYAAALLATLPTSPVEAATMAERFKFDPGPIILSQTVRIASVVLIVPVSIYIVDGWPGPRPATMTLASFDLPGILLLAAAALIGGFLFRFLRLPNPYFLGPLALSSALTATGFALSPYPPMILAIAQVVLGAWLGSTFRRELFQKAGRLILASISTTLLLLALSSAAAILLSFLVDMNWETLVLGAAPGGATEMALTAKFLGQNVALITAFHLVRIFIFMPNIPWVIRAIYRAEQRRMT